MVVDILKVLGTILVAVITTVGTGYFALKKMYVERQDKKDEVLLQKRIDDSIKAVREEITMEIKEEVHKGIVECGVIGDKAIREVQEEVVKKLEEGLKARGDEGKERFEINSKQIEANSKQLSENSKQIEELIGVVKEQAETTEKKFNALADSLTSLNTITYANAKSQRSAIFDKLLMVGNKILKAGKMTVNDKTNLIQLYNSWLELKGENDELDTLIEECKKLPVTPNEG